MGDNRRTVGFLVCDEQGRPLGWSSGTPYLYTSHASQRTGALFPSRREAREAWERTWRYAEKLSPETVENWKVAKWSILRIVPAEARRG